MFYVVLVDGNPNIFIRKYLWDNNNNIYIKYILTIITVNILPFTTMGMS